MLFGLLWASIHFMDFAVIKTGGKQYLVKPGDIIKVEKLKKPEKSGLIDFNEVLLVEKSGKIEIGKPYLKNVKVIAENEGEIRGKKITILRYHSKTRYRKKKGHRQTYTKVKIKEIK